MSTTQPDAASAFTHVDDDVLVSVICSARDRLLFMAPGVSIPVAEALADRWRALGAARVNVILDADAEGCRLGLATIEGLRELEAVAKRLGTLVAHQPQVRLGLVVSDSTVLMYAPEPLLVSDPAAKPQAVNAIRLDTVPAPIQRETGLGEDGVRDQTVGLDKVPSETVDAVEKDLKENPPLPFDVARTVNVFNAHFEFAELKLQGCAITRRTVPIPSELLGLAGDAQTRDLLKSTFRVLDPALDLGQDRVSRLKRYIAGRYLMSLGPYGTAVLRSEKENLITAVKALRHAVMRFQRRVERNIQAEIDRRRDRLIRVLLPGVRTNPPARWLKEIGADRSDEAILPLLKRDVDRALGKAEQALRSMDVSLMFKGVTYESLNDPNFIDLARKAMPRLRALHDEYQAARARPPAPQHEPEPA